MYRYTSFSREIAASEETRLVDFGCIKFSIYDDGFKCRMLANLDIIDTASVGVQVVRNSSLMRGEARGRGRAQSMDGLTMASRSRMAWIRGWPPIAIADKSRVSSTSYDFSVLFLERVNILYQCTWSSQTPTSDPSISGCESRLPSTACGFCMLIVARGLPAGIARPSPRLYSLLRCTTNHDSTQSAS